MLARCHWTTATLLQKMLILAEESPLEFFVSQLLSNVSLLLLQPLSSSLRPLSAILSLKYVRDHFSCVFFLYRLILFLVLNLKNYFLHNAPPTNSPLCVTYFFSKIFPPTLPAPLTCSIFSDLLDGCCLSYLHCMLSIQPRHLFLFPQCLLVRLLFLTLLIAIHLFLYNKMPPSAHVRLPLSLSLTHTQKTLLRLHMPRPVVSYIITYIQVRLSENYLHPYTKLYKKCDAHLLTFRFLYSGSFPQVKRPWREADLSSLCNSKVKNA
jgi:hypothetical protein